MKTIRLTDIAREIKMPAKLARQKFRRKPDEVPARPVKGLGWVFPVSAKGRVSAFLRNE